MRVGLFYLCLVFILTLLGFSCQRKTTERLPVINFNELLIKVGGALDSEFKANKVQQNSELIIIPNSEQNHLLMNFKSDVVHEGKKEKIQISISIPIDAPNGLPALGEYLFYNNDESRTTGTIAYFIAANDKSKMQIDYHFRFTTLIFRVEESDNDGMVANFLMTARQVAGYQRAVNKGDEIQLADDGRIQIQASFAAPVYNLPKVQKRELI